ncbi:MAG: (Fe-S)-binding protein, partial [Nitrospinae bacterium]|nr:(Fe-S)-binding protein [Nitrospinota bacterium]
MTELKYLGKYKPQLEKCVSCGQCQATCPTYRISGDEGMVARGKLNLIDAAIKGEVQMTPRWQEKLSHCTACLACGTNCPNGVNPSDIIAAAKAEFFSRNKRDFLSSVVLKMVSSETGRNLFFKLSSIGLKVTNLLFPDGSPQAKLLPFNINGIKRLLPEMNKGHFKLDVPEKFTPEHKKGEALFFTGCMVDHVFQEVGQ